MLWLGIEQLFFLIVTIIVIYNKEISWYKDDHHFIWTLRPCKALQAFSEELWYKISPICKLHEDLVAYDMVWVHPKDTNYPFNFFSKDCHKTNKLLSTTNPKYIECINLILFF